MVPGIGGWGIGDDQPMALQVCAVVGWTRIQRESRCAEHRWTKGDRPSEWDRLSRAIRDERPICERCGREPSALVHHRDERGPARPRGFDPDNSKRSAASATASSTAGARDRAGWSRMLGTRTCGHSGARGLSSALSTSGLRCSCSHGKRHWSVRSARQCEARSESRIDRKLARTSRSISACSFTPSAYARSRPSAKRSRSLATRSRSSIV